VLHLIVFCDDRHVIFKLGDIVLLQFRHYEKVPIILLAVLVIINAC
jgi:hypothetical protein